MKAPAKGRLVELFLSDAVRDARRGLASVGRGLARRPRRVRFYHRVDDVRSLLLARLVGPFADAYGLELELFVVPEPAAEVDPEPELRAAFAVADSRLTARHLGLDFPEPGVEPVAARVRLANALALAPLPPRAQLEHLIRISTLLLSRQAEALAALADELPTAKGQDVRPALLGAYEKLRRDGYYDGGTLVYEGEVYAGLDRLRHLEQRLVAEGLPDAGLAPRFALPPPPPVDAPLVPVDVFFSFRSPYSYLGVERLCALAEAYRITPRLRPILPMVMRGLPVPRDKRLYILRDARREAAAVGLPFGRVVDPLGAGVERCLALQVASAAYGAELAFARAALRGVFARGLDLTDDATLLSLAAEAGVPHASARAALSDDGFRAVVEANREALYDLGFWGVPTFAVEGHATFGQDRIPFLLEAVARSRAST